MKPVLRIIIIEDSPDDALLMLRELERAGYAAQSQRVQTGEQLRDALAHGTWDLVLADYSLPHFSATDGLAMLRESRLDVPFIVVSGSIGEEMAVQLMQDGAADYVMKDHLSRLGPAVQRELREAEQRRLKRDAEQALEESEKRYRLLYESMTMGIVYQDQSGAIISANPTAQRMLGLTLDQMQGRTSTDPRWKAVHEDGSPFPGETHPAMIALNSGVEVHDVLMGVYHPQEDRYHWLRIDAVPQFRAGERSPFQVYTLFDDVTEAVLAERALRQSESDLRQAQTLAHIGSWRWDVVHDQLTWSDEMYRIYGIDPKNALRSWNDVTAVAVHPEDRGTVEEANRSVFARHDAPPIEYRIVRPDGSVRTVWDQTGDMTLDEHGNVVALTGVVLDITDRKRAEAEREALQAQLHQSQKMEAIGQLAGGVAHDFNNLLTGILGNVAIMQEDLPATDPLASNLAAIENGARQAADLAKGLLTFGRKAMVRSVPLDMAQAIDTSLGILKQSLPATIDIVCDHELPSWHVLADSSQITQVVLNLAVNARDAMEGKGTLTIRLRNEVVGEAYVLEHPFARTGEFVHLSVADSGPGIPAEIQSHLFEPFYTTKEHGTGLGLSIVYGAVKQVDGWVTADSPAGGGAIFDIFLPRCHEPVMAPAAPALVRTGTDGGTVLIVEDEEVVRTVTAAMVGRLGYTALTAENGASALHVLQEHRETVDLILLDMTMPGMTTREIIPALRAISPAIPIVLASGFTSSAEIQQMLDDRTVQGFLGKPYPMSELAEMLRQMFRKK